MREERTGVRAVASRYGAPLSVIVLGAVTTVIAATQIFAPDESVFGMAFAAITMALGLSLVYGGYWMFASSSIDTRYHPKIATWTAAGIVLVGFVLGLMVLYQFAEGAEVKDPLFFIGGTVTVGGAGGFLVGIYDAERMAREGELERQNDRLEEFASVVSHDLRNPLNVARMRVELVQMDCDSDHLDDIARAHERMERLIDDLLTLAREGEQVRETEAVDLGVFARECWQLVETTDATICVDVDRTIRADRTQLRQLLGNLYRNAVEHGGDTVTVTVGRLDDGFYVEDSGPGIPPEERDRVFDTGYSTSEQGTGFGLRIVEQVARAHGWTVRVTDGADGGARFEITGVEFAQTHPGAGSSAHASAGT